jgi:hypothetical protein
MRSVYRINVKGDTGKSGVVSTEGSHQNLPAPRLVHSHRAPTHAPHADRGDEAATIEQLERDARPSRREDLEGVSAELEAANGPGLIAVHVGGVGASRVKLRPLSSTAMEHAEQLEHYKLAYAEYRAEVALGWSRARTFLVLGCLGPVAAVLSPVAPIRTHTTAVAGLCVLSIAAAGLGQRAVETSHRRYQAARERLEELARVVGVAPLQTTGGMRAQQGKPRGEGMRITTMLKLFFVLETLVNIAVVASR